MTDLAPFNLRASCDKCGGIMFRWSYWPDTSRMPQDPLAWKNDAPLSPQEHLRLTCANCGWRFAMKTKDAAE